MKAEWKEPIVQIIGLLIVTCLACLPAQAQYGGGAGAPDDPYQIWTAEQLNAIGANPTHWDKHFKLMADIDLSGYDGQDGRPAFNIIALRTDSDNAGPSQDLFTGVFDGNGHTVANFTHISTGQYRCAGLFGYVGGPSGEIRNLGMIHASVDVGAGWSVGTLAGSNAGSIVHCYSSGTLSGKRNFIGGLVGYNYGQVTGCHSAVAVDGAGMCTGGLVGGNDEGVVTFCYSTGAVHGERGDIGGLVGGNWRGAVTHCYSIGMVTGASGSVGGLVGSDVHDACVNGSFWDVQTSGQDANAQKAGTGLTTAQMRDMQTYLDAGWDWAGCAEDGTCETWQMPTNGGYPVLAFFHGYTPPRLRGEGTHDNPYLIGDASELGAMSHYSSYAHYRLIASIDLSGVRWATAVIPLFAGVFDGDGLTISRLTVTGEEYLGLFGCLLPGADIRDLAVLDVNVTGIGRCVGSLAADNGGAINRCYSSGVVRGGESVGGLVGNNGLWGTVTQCYSTAAVDGKLLVGALLGQNYGTITHCYSNGAVIMAGKPAKGLVAYDLGTVIGCFDASSSVGQPSTGRRGSLRALVATENPMQDKQTYLTAGWDWVGETTNGTSEVWQMPEGGGCPVLSVFNGYTPPQLPGRGTTEDPYLVSDANELGAVVHYDPCAHFRLDGPIDLSGIQWAVPVIPSFAGRFDGNGLAVSHLTVTGGGHLGLFGQLIFGAEVRDLGIMDANITGTQEGIGGLAGFNQGSVIRCHSTGTIKGDRYVGGLVGCHASGDMMDCRSNAVVTGAEPVGGLLGCNVAHLARCESAGEVAGEKSVGGLVGSNSGSLDDCHNAAVVDGTENVGGLIGDNWCGNVTHCSNSGAVAGQTSVGGLAGSSRDRWDEWERPSDPGAMTDCHNTGSVVGRYQVGGLVGHNSEVTTNCYSTGSVTGSRYVGGLVGMNMAAVMQSHSDGAVGGDDLVGGLMGYNSGKITECRSTGSVTGEVNDVGGLVGKNWHTATIRNCCTCNVVSGEANNVGGLVGSNWAGDVLDSYSISTVIGRNCVGGLVGINYRVLYYTHTPDDGTLHTGVVSRGYFAGSVSGREMVGGVIALQGGIAESSFWDTTATGMADMCGAQDAEGIGCDGDCGKATAEMQTAKTYLDAGWDFIGETANGTEDIWWIDEGKDYPRLWWEAAGDPNAEAGE